MSALRISLQDSERICLKALDLLSKHRNGIRFAEFVELVHKELPAFSRNSVYFQVWCLPKKYPEKVLLPEKGLYQLKKYAKRPQAKKQTVKNEEDYYQFVAEYLTELENCIAGPLGATRMGKVKWSNPDVLGVRRTDENDTIQATLEIISAEVKIGTNYTDLITGFGQACSYKLFSHKTYVVVPRIESSGDLQRLDSLCGLFGVGLVLYDLTRNGTPKFDLRHRALKSEPDNFFIAQHESLKNAIRELIARAS